MPGPSPEASLGAGSGEECLAYDLRLASVPAPVKSAWPSEDSLGAGSDEECGLSSEASLGAGFGEECLA